jgi:hypothetical protein
VTSYSRNATCTKGHRIEVSYTWDPDSVERATDYSELCPVSGCDGRVAGKLPVGADPSTLKLTALP